MKDEEDSGERKYGHPWDMPREGSMQSRTGSVASKQNVVVWFGQSICTCEHNMLPNRNPKQKSELCEQVLYCTVVLEAELHACAPCEDFVNLESLSLISRDESQLSSAQCSTGPTLHVSRLTKEKIQRQSNCKHIPFESTTHCCLDIKRNTRKLCQQSHNLTSDYCGKLPSSNRF